jgi:hypothetical protein
MTLYGCTSPSCRSRPSAAPHAPVRLPGRAARPPACMPASLAAPAQLRTSVAPTPEKPSSLRYSIMNNVPIIITINGHPHEWPSGSSRLLSLACRHRPPGALSLALSAPLKCSVAHSSPFFTLLPARNGCSHYGLMVSRFLLFHHCCCRFPLLRASCLLLKLERIAPLRPCCSPRPVLRLTSSLAQRCRVPSRRSQHHYRHHPAVRRRRTKTLPPQASSRRALPVSVVVSSVACKFSSSAPPPRR